MISSTLMRSDSNQENSKRWFHTGPASLDAGPAWNQRFAPCIKLESDQLTGSQTSVNDSLLTGGRMAGEGTGFHCRAQITWRLYSAKLLKEFSLWDYGANKYLYKIISVSLSVMIITVNNGFVIYLDWSREPWSLFWSPNVVIWTPFKWNPSKQETFSKCWFGFGPSSITLSQYQPSIGWSSVAYWEIHIGQTREAL